MKWCGNGIHSNRFFCLPFSGSRQVRRKKEKNTTTDSTGCSLNRNYAFINFFIFSPISRISGVRMYVCVCVPLFSIFLCASDFPSRIAFPESHTVPHKLHSIPGKSGYDRLEFARNNNRSLKSERDLDICHFHGGRRSRQQFMRKRRKSFLLLMTPRDAVTAASAFSSHASRASFSLPPPIPSPTHAKS